MSEQVHAAGTDVEGVATVEDCDALIVTSSVAVSAGRATWILASIERGDEGCLLTPADK